MDIKKALIQSLSERSLGLSRDQIEAIMAEELTKPEAEMDCEMVELCVELLAQQDGAQHPQETLPPVVLPTGKKTRHVVRKALLVAAIVVLLMAMALIVSAKVFHVDYIELANHALERITNGVRLTDKQDENTLPKGCDLRAELAKCHLEEVYLPESFLKDAKISHWNPQITDISQFVGFRLVKDGQMVRMCLEHFEPGFDVEKSVEMQGVYLNSWEVSLDGLAVAVIEFADRFVIHFSDDRTRYTIETYDMSAEETLTLVKHLKKE